MDASRRDNQRKLLALPMLGSLLFSSPLLKAQAVLQATPSEPAGPYYPRQWPSQSNNDLLSMNGQTYRKGTPLKLSGRVRSMKGDSLMARVEIWQSDENGLYRHPLSDGEGLAERGFHGYGWLQTSVDGIYSFRGLQPVPYSGRPAHIHFKVISPGYVSLTTQIYLVGQNQETIWLYRTFGGFSKARDRHSIDLKSWRDDGRNAVQAEFDIVLESV